MAKWFRTRIREARERAGLSQAELGEKFGVTQTTICNWENGTSEPRDEQYRRVDVWISGADADSGGQSAKPATQADEPSNLRSDDPTSPAAERANKVPVTTARRDRQLKPQDEDALLALVPQDGSAVTNLSLIKKLEGRGWSEEKYWRVRDRLLDTGTLIRGRGRGGSVRRRVAETVEPSTVARGPRVSVPEESLYPPLLKVLQTEWARDMRIEPYEIHFEETAKQGKKATGGTWTRPDITAVSVRSFSHLPNKYLDIWTFEAKTLDWLDVTAIFEAAAHASRATRSYALLQVPEKPDDRTEDILNRCEREATRLRVGLITFVDPARFATWETVVSAPRIDTDPELLEEFIATLSDAARKRLSQWK